MRRRTRNDRNQKTFKNVALEWKKTDVNMGKYHYYRTNNEEKVLVIVLDDT